jgi:hypothetical protein
MKQKRLSHQTARGATMAHPGEARARVATRPCGNGGGALHCAAVSLHPQQKKSLQSPTLFTTESCGMRYL